jgi:hypothetical protein
MWKFAVIVTRFIPENRNLSTLREEWKDFKKDMQMPTPLKKDHQEAKTRVRKIPEITINLKPGI